MSEGYRFICTHCNFGSSDPNSWKSHLVTKKHAVRTGVIEPKPESYSCKYCMYKTEHERNIKSHRLSNRHITKKILFNRIVNEKS